MKKFEYEVMTERQTSIEKVYTFQGEHYYDFLHALNTLGQEGWEWSGMHEGKYVMKREMVKDEE